MSWHLSSAWLGPATWQDNYAADANLSYCWHQIKTSDYSSSGFDQGYNCPSANCIGSAVDNSTTFLTSNMMPQAPSNNQQT